MTISNQSKISRDLVTLSISIPKNEMEHQLPAFFPRISSRPITFHVTTILVKYNIRCETMKTPWKSGGKKLQVGPK